jgi:signal transduction histidine kinase
MFGGDYLMQSIPIHDNWVFHDNDPDVEPLFVNENGRILRFAFKPGQSVKEHTAPNLPVYIAVLKGEGLFSGADSREKRFGAGDLLIFDIGEAHAIRADNEELVALLEFFASEPTELTADLVAIIEQIALQLGHVVERNQAEKALQNSQRRLRQLAGWVVEAQEEERQRVSRELHDEAGQALTALKISLELIQASLPEELTAVCDSLSDAINLTDETMEGIRLLAYNLRPPVLDQFGLDASLEGLCRDFAERIQVPISYQGIELLSLPDPTATSLYRFVQEALTNAAKHANASRIDVSLQCDDGQISLTVADDGRGFRVKSAEDIPHTNGMGLMGMVERLMLLGGHLHINSSPGQGTHLTATIPYQTVQAEE